MPKQVYSQFHKGEDNSAFTPAPDSVPELLAYLRARSETAMDQVQSHFRHKVFIALQ